MTSSPLESQEDVIPEIDICIVGGGLSGLTAAHKILSKVSTLRVVVLENGHKTGGELDMSALGELGGKWFLPEHYHIYELCQKLGLVLTNRDVSRTSVKRYWELDKSIFAPLARFELQRLIKEITLVSKIYLPGKFKLKGRNESMEKFICSRLFFESGRQFIRCFVRLLTGMEPRDITKTEFMSICQGYDDFSQIIDLFTGTSNRILEFPSQKLLRILEEKIHSLDIFLKTKVVEIVHYKNYVLVRDDRNNAFFARVLIMAIPWQKIQEVIFYPPIPEELRIPIFENKNMITSFAARYTQNHWRLVGHSGSVVMHNPHMICFEYAPFVYGGLVLHEEYFNEILQPIVLKSLSGIFGQSMGTPVIWQQKTWEQASILNLPPTSPWNLVIWASTNAATAYRGCLSGAVQSGYRAAVHALLMLRPQSIQWQDIYEIQRPAAVKEQQNWFAMKLCSFNLYNVSWYVTLAAVLYVGISTAKVIQRQLLE